MSDQQARETQAATRARGNAKRMEVQHVAQGPPRPARRLLRRAPGSEGGQVLVSWREILAAKLRLRAAEAPDGKPPRAPTSPRTKTWKPGTPKDPKKK